MALDAILHRKQYTWPQQLRQEPCVTIARQLYSYRQSILKSRATGLEDGRDISVVCISDTHNSQPALPAGDVLIHAGDLTQGGTLEELQAQLNWLNSQPHPQKVVIAGNHDIALDPEKCRKLGLSPTGAHSLRWGSITYLQHASTTLHLESGRKLKVFGHPSTRKHGNWAFQYGKGVDSFTGQIDDDADILITHSPPRFFLDVAGWGDEFLLRELWRVKPKLHVFGHVHAGHGRQTKEYDRFERLYEAVCAGHGGLLTLAHMAVLLLLMSVVGVDPNVQRTVLVNAAVAGGLQDQVCHRAQVVYL